MMRRIVAASLRFRFIAVGLAAALIIFGGQQVREMPIDVFPEFAPPRVEIQTASLGLSSVEIEELVTVPLEQVLQGVPGLDVMRSRSVPQLSSILLIFEPSTDIIAARQLIGERLATVTPTLPSWSTPPVMLQPLSSTSRAMKIGVSSDSYDVIDLSLLARWKIRPRLMQVPGVANVAIWGQRNEQLHVFVDPERLAANGITLQQLMQSTGDAFDAGLLKFTTGASVGTGGYVETPNQRIAIQHVQPIEDADELKQVVVAEVDGRIVRVGDIADVEINHQPLIGDAVINDGEGLLLIVEKFPWANTLEVTHGVEAALASIAPGLTGVAIDSAIFRPATFIEEAIGNLSTALLSAACSSCWSSCCSCSTGGRP